MVQLNEIQIQKLKSLNVSLVYLVSPQKLSKQLKTLCKTNKSGDKNMQGKADICPKTLQKNVSQKSTGTTVRLLQHL